MKALVCEMCNSNDLVKQDGFYVCQYCGTKYTVEEAKKLMVEGTVKIDKTDETKNHLLLARRARDDNNSENAEKYYSMVLQEDPNNWEAVFFQVYFKSTQCKVMDIQNAATSIANNMASTLKLIKTISDKAEQNKALDTVINYSNKVALSFTSAARNSYGQIKGAHNEAHSCVRSAYSINLYLEIALKCHFSEEKSRIITVQKNMIEHINSCRTYFGIGDNSYGAKEIRRLTQEIQPKDPSYRPPESKINNTKSGGCYVATAVYGSYNCPQVWTLRRYRDDILAKTWYGRAFIHTYYVISPTLVKWFGDTNWFKNMWKPKLDKMVNNLIFEGVKNTPYEDKIW